MDLKATLLKEHSRNQVQKVVDYIGDDPSKFSVLMNLFFSKTNRISQRAAWPVGIIAEKNPALIEPYLKSMINKLNEDVPNAVKRNTVRALQFLDIPNKLLGPAANNCFKLLQSKKEPIAVKVFSMTVLANICKKVPEIGHELKITIEDQMPFASAGFKSRGNKILKELYY